MNSSSSNSATLLHPGDKLDKYEIVGQIGAGGMAVVWKGHDKLMNKMVAIKQLNAAAASPEAQEQLRERFLKEAAIQKRLSAHQKFLVKIVDFLAESRGLFIVMEYVEGVTLAQLLAQNPGPMDERQALGIVGGTALALEGLHKHNVVHRDLKPSNILLPKEGGLKLCDFGLSAIVGEQDELNLGSVRYMAPELFGGEEFDGRADVYALGMVAYEMLAGRDKFNEVFKIIIKDQRNQSLRWMKWHSNQRIKAPPLSQLRPEIIPALSDIVARMMEKDPGQRIGSATELLEIIRRHFSGDTPTVDGPAAAQAQTPAPAEPTAPLPRKSNMPMLLAATAVLWILAGLAMYLGHNAQVKSAEISKHKAALAEFAQARQLLQNGDYATARDRFIGLAAQWPGDRDLERGSQARAALSQALLDKQEGNLVEARATLNKLLEQNILDHDYLQHEKDLIDAQLARSDISQVVEKLARDGRFADARGTLEKLRRASVSQTQQAEVDRLAALIEDQDRQQQVTQVLDQARQLRTENQPEKALQVLAEAQQRFQARELSELWKTINSDQEYGKALAAARQAEKSGDLARSIEAYNSVIKLRGDDELQGKVRQFRGQQAYQQGLQQRAAGDAPAAAESFKQALTYADIADARKQLAEIESTNQRQSLLALARQAENADNLETAITHYRNALTMGDDPQVQQHIQQLQSQIKLRQAQALLQKGSLEEARAAFSEVLALDPANSPARAGLSELGKRSDYLKHLNEGDAARKQSKFSQATLEYRRAKAVFDTPEIQQRLDDIEYDKFIAAGKADIAAEKWISAKGNLLTARKLRNTPEVRDLLAKVEPHAPTDASENR